MPKTTTEEKRDWRPPLRGAVLLTVVVTAWSTLLGVTGLLTRSSLTFFGTVGIEILGLGLILWGGRRRGNGFRRQVAEGALVVVVLAVLLGPATYLGLTWVTPDYADRLIESARATWEAQGADPRAVEEQVAVLRRQFVPVKQALYVVPGTMMTLLPAVPVLAALVRSRSTAAD